MKRQKTGDNVWMLHPVDTVDPQTAPTHRHSTHRHTTHTLSGMGAGATRGRALR